MTATLKAGTNLTLRASSDVAFNSAVTVNNTGGNGGALIVQAGRSVLVNADITTDNADLTPDRQRDGRQRGGRRPAGCRRCGDHYGERDDH